jgi:transposase
MVSTIVSGHYLGLSMAKKRRKRRHWHDDEKREIVAQTRVPGVSVSRVARRYDVNANLVFKWLRDPRFRPADEDMAQFLPVEVLSEPVAPIVKPVVLDSKIEIQLSNGHRLSVSGGFDPDAVARLLHGLSS